MKTTNVFYWIKLQTDFFKTDGVIDFLMSQPNGSDYVVLYQMLCLKTANLDGQLAYNVGEMIIPYDVEKIARDTRYFSVDTVRVALELFKQIGLIYKAEDGSLIKIRYEGLFVGTESSNKEAIKKRKYREKKKISENATQIIENAQKSIESGQNVHTQKGTKCPTEIRDKSIDIYNNNIYVDSDEPTTEKKAKTKPKKNNDDEINALFERLWKIYIRKEGKSQVSKKAKKELFECGYDRVARSIENYIKIKSGTEKQYLLMGSTFFNGRWKDYEVVDNGTINEPRTVNKNGGERETDDSEIVRDIFGI